MSWRDPGLAYDPVAAGLAHRHAPGDYSQAPPRIFQGDFEVKELFEAWRPHVVISIVVDKLNKADRRAAGDRLDRVCRWAFRTGYALSTLLVAAFFFQLD